MEENIPDSSEINVSVQDQFLHVLHLGTGQAMHLLRDHPELDFSKHLIHAACNNLAYDPQCEGSRAGYIFTLIKRVRQKAFIVAQVLRKLKNKKSGFWDLDQLCDLALLFYRDGFTEARDVFLQRFDKNLIQGYEFCGEEQILRLEGGPGLLRLAEVAGKLHPGENDFISRWHVDEFQSKNKAIDVDAELAQAAKANPDIQRYFDGISATARLPRHKRIKGSAFYTFDQIMDKINSPSRYGGFSEKFASQMDQAVVDTLAQAFLNEKDVLKRAKYLRFFTVRKFPLDYAPILKIAGGKIAGQSRLVPNAVGALGFFEGDDIRRLALDKLASDEKPHEYILLLKNNFQEDDVKLLMRLIDRADNFDDIHRLISDFLELFCANPNVDCQGPLLAMYARMNCALHRRNIVCLLYERNLLPGHIISELKFDSRDEIRKFYRQTASKNRNDARNGINS